LTARIEAEIKTEMREQGHGRGGLEGSLGRRHMRHSAHHTCLSGDVGEEEHWEERQGDGAWWG
jgi:hypothetical protein